MTNIASIGIQTGADKFREPRLRDILQSLKDPASTVRETAALQVRLLNDEFGFEWMQHFIFEEMNKIYSQSGNYLHRMVPLKAIQLMAASTKNKGKAKGLSAPAAIDYFTALLRVRLKDNHTVLIHTKFAKDSKFKDELKEILHTQLTLLIVIGMYFILCVAVGRRVGVVIQASRTYCWLVFPTILEVHFPVEGSCRHHKHVV